MSATPPVRAAIGLGSNLSEPMAQITQALIELGQLPSTQLLAQSPLYQSRAVGPEQPDFINACALLETQLAALELLDALQALEQKHQRVRLQHWGPRTLDLDLLLYGKEAINIDRLTVPHPYLRERNFVLMPLHDIWPEAQLPSGESIASLRANCTMDGLSPITHQANHKE
ncbi:2-amino-4-hydroxy-6-hydroxymethyldihydropteridine diphosphokinase [Simiduia litorea]|uniref:2-amino-4-hydroxy-6- hydroxymethyldihydropteridine diphosphokinase n=1 Tax=Simiduia litorea TaxID=1435348 RepID=UPI0036F2A9F5